MKLRSIELTNVRRFAGKTARLSGIGDGLTVLSEANEFGKSTFFDAIHAVFFEKHNSKNAAIKSLQPHAGGAPEVVVEIDLPEGRRRISKRWINRAQAQVTDAHGRLIHQADEAEAWIDRLIGGGLSGPSGLLWVRQGLMGMEPDGTNADDKRIREEGLSARRGLLSSVTSEIDMMTGGRRMDAVIDRVASELSRLVTAGGKAKAGGEWARLVDEAAGLAKKETELRHKADLLSDDLKRRSEVQRILTQLTDPSDKAAREQAVLAAKIAFDAALAHQAQVTQAETALRLAKLHEDRAKQDVITAESLSSRLGQARSALTDAERDYEKARLRAEDLNQRHKATADALEEILSATRDLRARLQAANRAQAALQAQGLAADLQRRFDRSRTLQDNHDRIVAQRSLIHVTGKHVEAAEKAQSEVDLARARAEAQAVTIDVRPDSAPATLNGATFPLGPVPILAATNLILPGFGSIYVDPNSAHSGNGIDSIAAAEQKLAHILALASVETLEIARRHWAQAQQLDNEAKQISDLLGENADDGIDALRTRLANALAAAADAPDEVEDVAEVNKAVLAAEAEEQAAQTAVKSAQSLAVIAGEERATAEANRAGAQRQLEVALDDAGDPDALLVRIHELKTVVPNLSAEISKAVQELDALNATASDIATSEARLNRAQSSVEQSSIAERKANDEFVHLNATILARAEEGVEESLLDVSGRRTAAEDRAARYEAEVRALTRLRRALDEARTKARDAYFEPVLRELQPLLRIIHPDALVTINEQSLLPAALNRNGQEEALDILSGGTREQVAILTRLAFARLFATSGRSVPVILDDALVHSDDDRIEAMFDALHRSARDQQILVLTCRQRAFAKLGGERAEVQVEVT